MSRNSMLLCYARNTPYSYDAHTPLSILSLGTYLEKNGVDVDYFDERIEPHSRFRTLLKREPLLVGFSVIGGYQIEASMRLAKDVRRLSPESRIIWGGITPTTLAAETLEAPFVDFVVKGEGEETLLELFRAFEKGGTVEGIQGLGYRDGGHIRMAPSRTPPDVEALPFVYQGKALELLGRYLKSKTVRQETGYEASRGCPFLCTFCYSPNFHSDTRVKSAAKIEAELKALREAGVTDLDVYDDTLVGGRPEAIGSFADALKRYSMSWIGNLRINMVSADLIERIAASGCKWLYFGIESNDDETLRRIKKGYDSTQLYRGLELMRSSGQRAVYSVIMGLPLPGEAEKIPKILNFADELHRFFPQSEVQIQSYVPLPGSDLYDAAHAMGFRPPRRLLDWVDHDHFNVSNPWLQEPDLGRKLYLSTFLAYRYRRHLSYFPINLFAYPLHRLSLWRLRHRRFGWFFEKILYDAYMTASRLWVRLYFAFQNL